MDNVDSNGPVYLAVKLRRSEMKRVPWRSSHPGPHTLLSELRLQE
jgi:hypothetical protein